MPTRKSQAVLGMIRSHKKFAAVVSRDMMQMEPPINQVAKLRMFGTRGQVVSDLGMPPLMVFPRKQEAEDCVLLHLHGGAYVSGGLMQCRALISPICAFSGVSALTFSYRLAPQYPYPAQLEDALAAYDYLREKGYAPHRIVLVGESAGGNLALALTAKLREQGEALPAALCLLSPWADLAQTGESYTALRGVDATLNPEELLESAIAFAGSRERLTAPDISPVYGDFHGFPPTLIHCGTSEILLSDSERLEAAMLRDGAEACLVRWEGMCHVFQAFGFEESRAANRQIGLFIRKMLGLPGPDGAFVSR